MSERGYAKIFLTQGESWGIEFTYKINGVPQPLTGYSAKMQFRDRVGGRLIKEISSPSSGITITEALGKVAGAMTPADTELFSTTSAVWDLRLVSPSGAVIIPVGGDVEVTLGVTKV